MASPWQRLGAIAINWFVGSLPAIPLVIAMVDSIADGVDFWQAVEDPELIEFTDASMWLLILTFVMFAIVNSIHIVLLAQNGWTIGKRLMGIRVVRPNGAKVSVLRFLLLREGLFSILIGILNTLTLVGGWIFQAVDNAMVFSQRGRTLHDRAADTLVVRAR